ncbi:cyd operon YbgE family protein [uncultured Microbulbifer sp.]|uniref:cyd operon YbgE family protein n=1 Tax=uncultured Microbulbifer sp. TaxID=348147 RepID=UPI00262BDAE8|nr:cyd operon YbgE family protein [uncultured Microbulbifer sp.]
MKILRITTFVVALLVSLVITFWPLLLYKNGTPPSTGQTSLLLLGLCVGVVYGSGILSKTPRNWQLGCALVAWSALAAIGWLALP